MSENTRWARLIERRVRDTARLYVEARVAGLEVSHFDRRRCVEFDSTAGRLGVFRDVGELIFYKDERRWEVRAACDANSVDLSSLILTGIETVAMFGGHPGHWTRRRYFVHEVSKRTGKRIAHATVAYQLTADDLLLGDHERSATSVDDSQIVELLSSSGDARQHG